MPCLGTATIFCPSGALSDPLRVRSGGVGGVAGRVQVVGVIEGGRGEQWASRTVQHGRVRACARERVRVPRVCVDRRDARLIGSPLL